MFELLFERFNQFYESLFFRYGKFLSKHYAPVILVSLVVGLVLSSGLFQFKVISNPDDLYMTIDSTARTNEARLKRLFNTTENNENKFFVHQLLDVGTWAEINFHPKPNASDNIIDKVYFDEIRHVHARILDEILVNDTNTNRTQLVGYMNLCAKRLRRCAIEGVGLLDDDFFEFLRKNSLKLSPSNSTSDDATHDNDDPLLNSNLIYIDNRLAFNDLTFSLGSLSVLLVFALIHFYFLFLASLSFARIIRQKLFLF
jgi:hypothetical protein